MYCYYVPFVHKNACICYDFVPRRTGNKHTIQYNLRCEQSPCREFSQICVLCRYVDVNIKYHAHYGETISTMCTWV